MPKSKIGKNKKTKMKSFNFKIPPPKETGKHLSSSLRKKIDKWFSGERGKEIITHFNEDKWPLNYDFLKEEVITSLLGEDVSLYMMSKFLHLNPYKLTLKFEESKCLLSLIKKGNKNVSKTN